VYITIAHFDHYIFLPWSSQDGVNKAIGGGHDDIGFSGNDSIGIAIEPRQKSFIGFMFLWTSRWHSILYNQMSQWWRQIRKIIGKAPDNRCCGKE
jgi:hypothetical protein